MGVQISPTPLIIMVDLDEETIDVIKKVKDALKETTLFDINSFNVGETGAVVL